MIQNNSKRKGRYKTKDDTKFKQMDADAELKRVQLEGLQLLDNNAKNDEIKNN